MGGAGGYCRGKDDWGCWEGWMEGWLADADAGLLAVEASGGEVVAFAA